MSEWSLLTNHARLLLAIQREPGLRVRDMADRLNLTERGIALILRDLREAGYVRGRREGRRVHYSVVATKPLRSDAVRHHTVGDLLELLTEAEGTRAGERNPKPAAARPAVQ